METDRQTDRQTHTAIIVHNGGKTCICSAQSRNGYNSGIVPAQSRNSHFAGRSKNSYLARFYSGIVPAQSRNRDKVRIYYFPAQSRNRGQSKNICVIIIIIIIIFIIIIIISDRVLHMDNPKPIYTLLLLQFVVGILDHVLYCVHGQPANNIFPTSNCSGNILLFTWTTRNHCAPNFLLRVMVQCRNIRAGSTLYGILDFWKYAKTKTQISFAVTGAFVFAA